MKTNFSITIKMTSTKLIAWAIFIVCISIIGLIPDGDRALYMAGVLSTVVLLYTGKTMSTYYTKKLNSKEEEEEIR